MRNNFKIGPLNSKAAEIGKAKDALGPRIGLHVLGKPSHHSLSVGQKRKHRRWRGANSYFVPYLAAFSRFMPNFNI